MIYSKIIEEEKEKERLYGIRYETFVVKDKDAPPELYPNGLLKDSCDEKALHVGCYEENKLLGFLSIILKEKNVRLPIEEQHEILVGEKSAEIMRLIISEENIPLLDYGKRGRVLKLLLSKVKEISDNYHLDFLYLVSTRNVQSIYERIGFHKIGKFRSYFNISDECPMKLDLKKIKISL